MNQLVIHPEDPSTTFLKPIYKNAQNKVVIQQHSSPNEVQEGIKGSDRVMIMGHGAPTGLFNVNHFYGLQDYRPYAIGQKDVEILKASDQNIYIWCNADQFIERHDLHGFYSGMFISEVGEAMYCGVPEANQDMVDESNDSFAEIVGRHIDLPIGKLYARVLAEYGELAKTNPVAKFNHDRLYIR